MSVAFYGIRDKGKEYIEVFGKIVKCNFLVFTLKTGFFMVLTVRTWLSPFKLAFKVTVSGVNLLNLIEYGKCVRRMVYVSSPFSRTAMVTAWLLQVFEDCDEIGIGFLVILSYLIPFYISAVPPTNLNN